MKRILLSLLLAISVFGAVVLSVNAAENPGVQAGKRVQAAAEAMVFPTDGTQYTAPCPVCGQNVKWTALTAEDLSGGITLVKATHYYLAESVNAAGVSISAPGSASHISCLHLNGKDLTSTDGVVITGNAGTLNIMGSGEVKGTGNSGATYAATMHINTGGTNGRINLYGGTYSKVNSDDTENVIAIRNNGGEINLYDGATIKSGTKGSAVYMWGGLAYVNATFNMYGGIIDATGSSEVAVDMAEVADGKIPKQSFNMYGGTIKNGNGTTGGNVTVRKNGTFNMYGGTITGGVATSGGNMYIDSYGTFNMYGGIVSGIRDENGTATGGIADNGGNVYLAASTTLNITGGKVLDGTASSEGGNIYAKGGTTTFANILLRDVLISGGNATSYGGNISVTRSNLTIEEGAQILDGVSQSRAGSLRAYQSTVTMTGGTIGGGTSNYTSTNRPHDVWLAGANSTNLCKMYMLGGVIDSKDSCVGAAITAGSNSVLYLGGSATMTNANPANDSVYVTSKAYICDGWSGEADVRFSEYKEAGKTISSTYGSVITLGEDLSETAGGSFTGKLAQSSMAVCQSGSSLVVQKAAMVDSDGYRTATADLLTDWVNGSYAYIQLYGNQTIEDLGGNTLWVDLNGYDLTVGGSGALHVFDSANDSYKASKCGTVTNNGTVVITEDLDAPNGNRYIAITEGSKTTMHRLEMELTAVTLRPTAAGLYYKAIYSCDEVLSAKVARYGVVVSLQDMPGADFLTEWNENRYTVSGETFKSGVITTSGSVFGIMKDKNSTDTNAANGEMKIYANPYICFDMGSDMIVVGDKKNPGKTATDETFDGVAYSLRDTMGRIDKIYYQYNSEKRTTIDSFFKEWQDKGMDWDFDHIAQTDRVDNSNLSFAAGTTNALCPVCRKSVTWKKVTQAEYGTTAIGAAASGDHYYLAEDIVYTGTEEQFIRAPGSGAACLHLNGHDLTATNTRAVYGYSGTINVMGNGTVCGNGPDENRGATVQINTGGTNGAINLYGGTYIKPAGNKTAAIIAVADNGGQINLYEDVTVCGDGTNYAIYSGEAVLVNTKIGIYGATVVGGSVRVAEPDTDAANTSTLDIMGNAYLEDVAIGSMYVKVTLSGAPVIDRLAMVVNQQVYLNGLGMGADITVSTRDVFTQSNENIAEYAAYFHPWVETDKLTVTQDNTLRYDINYELYMTPYKRDVVAEAIADGKIHYYFMAGEGMVMNPTTSGELDKWGDSCLIVFPDGKTMLVDSGYAIQQPVIAGSLKRMGVTQLDYILITHPHNDHVSGVFANGAQFLDQIPVTKVYHSGINHNGTGENATVVERVCTERGIPCEILEQGDALDFGEVHMEVLWPLPGTSETTVSSGKINDNSMVFRLDYGEHSGLFTADLYEAGEKNLMDSVGTDIVNTDFLKVPHHGWNTSSSEAFVNAVNPELAVATGRVEMPASYQSRYTSLGATLLFDLYNGYIHVSAGADGTMTYETSR